MVGASGDIGRHVIRMARGHGMEVLGQDLQEDPDFAKEAGFTYVDLETLCAESDVVTVHVPHNVKTHHLIARTRISKV